MYFLGGSGYSEYRDRSINESKRRQLSQSLYFDQILDRYFKLGPLSLTTETLPGCLLANFLFKAGSQRIRCGNFESIFRRAL